MLHDFLNGIDHGLKSVLDWLAFGTGLGYFFGLIPHVAGLLSITWLSIQIYDRFNKKKDK